MDPLFSISPPPPPPLPSWVSLVRQAEWSPHNEPLSVPADTVSCLRLWCVTRSGPFPLSLSLQTSVCTIKASLLRKASKFHEGMEESQTSLSKVLWPIDTPHHTSTEHLCLWPKVHLSLLGNQKIWSSIPTVSHHSYSCCTPLLGFHYELSPSPKQSQKTIYFVVSLSLSEAMACVTANGLIQAVVVQRGVPLVQSGVCFSLG